MDVQAWADIDVEGVGLARLRNICLACRKGWQRSVGAIEGEGTGGMDRNIDLDGGIERWCKPECSVSSP